MRQNKETIPFFSPCMLFDEKKHRDDPSMEASVAGIEAGDYAKSPDLDLALVGDDTSDPRRKML